jgi:hypothetical protein
VREALAAARERLAARERRVASAWDLLG